MEDRIQNLKNELKRKKDEARKLLKAQQLKKKEALKQQEVKLRKQIQVSFMILLVISKTSNDVKNLTSKGKVYFKS